MLGMLKPLEALVAEYVSAGPLRDIFFFIFKFSHLYLAYFADYLLFLLFAILPYYLVPRQWRVFYLLIASVSLISYLYGPVLGIGLFAFPLLIHFLVQRLRARALSDKTFRKRALGALVVFILLVYGLLLARESFFWDWEFSIWHGGFMLAGLHFCGIAYMLPKLIHYAADTFNGRLEPARTLRFALFMVFFPTLRMGPILRFQNFNRDIEDLERGGPNWLDLGFGIWRIALGLVKMRIYVFLLLNCAVDFTEHEAIRQAPWVILYWNLAISVFGVYLNFGGYSDLAIGFSRMLGFHAPENFYLPFFSNNIGEWWRRWHISLSFWLRDYVYRPLGGNRQHAAFNILVTFLICGAWHALSLNYIIWGLGQGIGLVFWQYWRRFWYRVKKKPGYMDALKPLLVWMRRHPRLAYFLAAYTTFNYFCLTGIYFIFEFELGNLFFLRFITFGLAQGN